MLGLLLAAGAVAAGTVTVDIENDRTSHEVPKTLYGIFFEDINFAADGGLYPELLENRGFDWKTSEPDGWHRDCRGGGMARITRQFGRPVHEASAGHLRIEAFGAGTGTGVQNRGYHGIHVEAGAKYDLSFYARALDGYKGGVRAVLEKDGRTLCEYKLANSDLVVGPKRENGVFPLPEWRKYKTVFVPGESGNVTFSLLLDSPGAVEFEQVSLYPKDTFRGRANGLRRDLAQLLADLKPGIVRFPGGCLTEGRDWPQWYDWKLSVGDGTLESRSCIWNTWGYWQTMGLGYYEYFCFCEDIGAEPLPVMNSGLTCQFAKPWDLAPLENMDYFVKNFCDLVEFANGDPKTTKWGAVRAKMGHPAPFNMKYLGIGNENWGAEYLDRFEAVAKEMRRLHPEIRIVSSSGAGPGGREFDYAWNRLTTETADVVDEHYYVSADWLLGSTKRYDGYDRSGRKPKVYAGEYACHLPNRANSLYSALCEAAMMTGFERNSDIVEMTSYAPLFCKIGGTQWKTDLIWFDNAKSFGTPNYYVQKMFSRNLPTRIVPSSLVDGTERPLKGRVALQTWNTAAEIKDLKVVDASGRVLLSELPDPAKCARDAGGDWRLEGGVLRQVATDKTDTLLRFGDDSWGDVKVSFKFRRTAGAEGVIVALLVDGEHGTRRVHANLGGWGNVAHAFESTGYGLSDARRVDGGFATGEWYNVSVSLRGDLLVAKVNGAVATTARVSSTTAPEVFETCGRDEKSGELVVKLVNTSEAEKKVDLRFAKAVPAGRVALQRLGGGRDDENSIAEPKKCATVEGEVKCPGGRNWSVALPPFSLSVYRIKGGY